MCGCVEGRADSVLKTFHGVGILASFQQDSTKTDKTSTITHQYIEVNANTNSIAYKENISETHNTVSTHKSQMADLKVPRVVTPLISGGRPFQAAAAR